MGPVTHAKDGHIFRFLINQEPLYCELLETCVGPSAVGHCGGPQASLVAPLGSLINLRLTVTGGVLVWWRSFTELWRGCDELFRCRRDFVADMESRCGYPPSWQQVLVTSSQFAVRCGNIV